MQCVDLCPILTLPQPSSYRVYYTFQSEAIDMLAVRIGLHKGVNYPTHTTQQFTMATVSLATSIARSA